MIVLGIETSCDETAAAVVKDGKDILSSVVLSSSHIHTKTGGVIPESAARAQVEYINTVLLQSLKIARIKPEQIDLIACTVGPGLIGSLLVGIESAKTLSYVWNKPIAGVNHMLGHIYANFLQWQDNPKEYKVPVFPILSLVVSGGHTDLVYMNSHNDIFLVGSTRDDAAGEAFDKCARILGLPYPGGPSISKASEQFLNGNSSEKLNLFPRPLKGAYGYDFSFSGLKTSVFKYVTTHNVLDKNFLSAQIQEAIVESLVNRTNKALEKYSPKSFLLSGGVAANKRLKEVFYEIFSKAHKEIDFFVPSPIYCTDNAAMVASCAYYCGKKCQWNNLGANPQLLVDQI